MQTTVARRSEFFSVGPQVGHSHLRGDSDSPFDVIGDTDDLDCERASLEPAGAPLKQRVTRGSLVERIADAADVEERFAPKHR